MRNWVWSTFDIGKAENEAWFYSKVTVSSCHYSFLKTPAKNASENVYLT